jgi:hypothetical protein
MSVVLFFVKKITPYTRAVFDLTAPQAETILLYIVHADRAFCTELDLFKMCIKMAKYS